MAALGVARHVLARPHLADHNRIYRFQVGGVRLQREVDGPAADLEVGRGTGMVLSPPSSPKRVVETYFFAQKASNPSASVRCSRIWRLAALSKAVVQGAP